jgi:hypothetical protein
MDAEKGIFCDIIARVDIKAILVGKLVENLACKRMYVFPEG